jgi:hypothetical protein
MKSLLLSLLLVVAGTCAAQVRVEPKEKSYLYLLTTNYEIITSSDGKTTYYQRVFMTGYEYPAIREGFYINSIFTDINGLVKHYTELVNLENLEDGEYKLSVQVRGGINAIKTGSKVKLKDGYNIYNYGKYKIEDIKTDLELLKSMLNR